MLPNFWHRDFAHKRALGNQERHLLYFAATPDADAVVPEEEENEEALEENETPAVAPEQNVDDGVGETRGAVEGALNDTEQDEEAESVKEADFEALGKKIDTIQERLSELTEKKNDMRKLIREKTKGEEQQGHLDDLDKIMNFTENVQNNLNGYSRIVTAVTHMQIGAITPATFEKDFMEITQYKDGKIEDFDAESIAAELADIDAQGLVNNERTAARRTVFDKVMTSRTLVQVGAFIDGQLESINESIASVEEYSKGLEDSDEDTDEGKKMTWASFWAGTTSINNMIAGTKKYIEAVKKSFEEWNQLKEARIAQGLGANLAWLPLGKQTQVVLDRQTESANDTVRDEHKQGLEAQKPSFAQVVEMIHKTKNDNPNHFRALLEYAADRCWLYDYDAINGTAFGINIQNHLPETWEDQNRKEYLRELDNKNGSGQDTEKKRGYDRVVSAPDISVIIRVLHDELSRGNYWAAHGILKRGMEKGKEGDASTWMTNTIFRYLRDDTNARKYFPKDLLDDLGNIGIVHPCWTSTYFKLDRHTIEAWQKTDKGVEHAGNLGSVIAIAENHLLEVLGEANMPKDTQELDRIVARILATQTVTYKGKEFSIFDDRYKAYRKGLGDVQTSINPRDADDDFFSMMNKGSEMILLGTEAYRGILGLQSTGEFNEPIKAQYFLDQLIGRSKNLENKFTRNSRERLNYIRATQKRMNNWLITNANDDRSAVKLGNSSFQDGTPMMLGLVKADLITMDTILRLNTKDKNGSLSAMIVRQVLKDPSGPYVSAQEIMRTADNLKAKGQMNAPAHKVIAEVVKDTSGYVTPASQQTPTKSRDGSSSPTTQAV
jgi:hypothetical protein